MGIEKFAVIGRPPTQEQVDFAAERGIVLVPIGDADLFWVDRKWVWDRCHGADGVVVSHAGAALRLLHHGLKVAVFECERRSPIESPSEFFPLRLWVYSLVSEPYTVRIVE